MKMNELVEAVKELSVTDVLGSYLELRKSGRYFFALCPFHNDRKIGSFVIDPVKNYWKCYSCGEGGDSITFVEKYFSIGFVEAIKKIAVDQGLISSTGDIDSLSAMPFHKKVKETPKEIKAPEEIIDAVYSVFPVIFPLTKGHIKVLKTERFVENTDDFFSFRRIADIETAVLNALANKEISLAREAQKWLPYVPGFFIQNKKIKLAVSSGLGFLIRDHHGIIRGIQIRNDTTKTNDGRERPRYIWLSSSFAISENGFVGGAASGAPAGFIKSDMPFAHLCITEGRFKAMALAKAGFDAIYLAGVSAWRPIIPLIKEIANGRENILLCFDADIMANTGVYLQLSQLGKELLNIGLNPWVALWSKDLGKGFDDFYNVYKDDYKKHIKYLKIRDFCFGYNKMLLKTQESNEDINSFSDELQKNVEEYFLERKKVI